MYDMLFLLLAQLVVVPFCSIRTCDLWYNYAVVYRINALWFVV